MTKREQERIDRLLSQLGHIEAIAALQHAVRMQTALKVVHTWMSVPESINTRQVQRLCMDALERKHG